MIAAASPAAWIDLWKVLITAGSGLVGVVVGGIVQLRTAYALAERQRKHQLKDEADARDRAAAETAAQRNFVRALLARHLEAFARTCADAMWRNGNPDIDGAAAPPVFPDWPSVGWELLGAREMVDIRDLEIRVAILRDATEGSVYYGATHEGEARDYYAEGAAAIGLEAWRIAERLRREAGAEPFRFPREGANYAEALAEHVARVAERARLAEERRGYR